ncbi:LCP family protein [Paenibacillus sp. N3.4]|uniref:LCP family protein n=1 Tax=Paenibacillus sp. N3.4 TaxID=2603222 RepID=UPI0011CB0867|nr:LCP family protein [Paenibacillus sp. N3.4]TXK81391.1 LytR family transcriptional regulator [Paenibacillus sp. N3.4]
MNKRIKKPRLRKPIVISLMIFGLLAASVSVYAAFIYNKVNQTINHIAAQDPSVRQNQSGVNVNNIIPVQHVTKALNKPITFLLAAVDEREGSDGSLNTDVLMLASVNPISHQATIVSIPRDLEITSAKSGLETSHKANYFYAYNYNKNKQTALMETKKMFSDIYQVPIDYMAIINFEGFRRLVDQFGGMMIDVEMDMRYEDDSDGTHIHLNRGSQLLDGKQVLDYVRYRKSNLGTAESSDIERNQREQLVLNQLLDKMTSLNGLAAWGKVLDIIGETIKTDVPADELRTYMSSYRDLKPSAVNFIHLDGEWESPYIVIKEKDLDNAMEALRGQTGLVIDSPVRTD